MIKLTNNNKVLYIAYDHIKVVIEQLYYIYPNDGQNKSREEKLGAWIDVGGGEDSMYSVDQTVAEVIALMDKYVEEMYA